MVKISVIIPVYNVEKYLERCIESVLNQTFHDIELILVNDGSTDNSLDIIKRYAQTDKNRVVEVNKENGGLSDARNFGIQVAKGEYLFFLDSDDWIEQNLLFDLYHEAINKQLDIVICGFSMINEKNVIFSQYGILKEEIRTSEQYILESSEACNKLYKKELFNQIEFPISRWYEDLAVIPIIMMKANKIGQIDTYGYYYFNRSNSITKSYNIKILDILYAFDLLIGSNTLSEDVLYRLYIKHLYYSLIRIGQVKKLIIMKKIFKEIYDYTCINFDIEILQKKLNPKQCNCYLLTNLFFKNKFNLYTLVIKVETLGMILYKKVKFTLIK